MIDAIETLKKLNETFPKFQIPTLLKIIDCYVEKDLNSKPGIEFLPKRHHIKDKTSSHQRILTQNAGSDYDLDKEMIEYFKK